MITVHPPFPISFEIFGLNRFFAFFAFAEKYELSGKPSDYHYASQGNADTIKHLDDKAEFVQMKVAMKAVGFKETEIEGVFKVVGGILHLGNVTFGGSDKSNVSNKAGQYFAVSPH